MKVADARKLLNKAVKVVLDSTPFTGEIGTVYIIHLETPLGHAKHYVGWAINPEARIAHHANGSGSTLMRAVQQAGIEWHVSQVIEGVDRYFERYLKNRGSATQYCPCCRGKVVISSVPSNWTSEVLPRIKERNSWLQA